MHVSTGFSCSAITPEKKSCMAGYDGRQKKAEGVHDDLYVRCLIIKTDSGYIVLAALDLLGIDGVLGEKIKNQIENCDRDIKRQGIYICATHTHSGPSTMFWDRGCYDDGYADFIVQKSREAFLHAKQDLRDSELFSEFRTIKGIASKRNSFDEGTGCEGIKCSLLNIRRDDGTIMLINFPCHMTVLDENNLYYSRDMIFGLELTLRENNIDRFIFINGAAGDISTRFFKEEPSFGEAERLGRMLGNQILNTGQNNLSKIGEYSGDFRKAGFLLKYNKNLTEEEKKIKRSIIEGKLSDMGSIRLRRDLESALLVLKRQDRDFSRIPDVIKSDGCFYIEVEICCTVYGGFCFVGIPFEIYYNTGIKIENILKEKFNCHTVFILGYCNGYGGYIPPTEDFSSISYETVACSFEKDSEQKLIETVKSL
jgi:Neutral/alkaline non-lysosomal ceramidase.